MKKKILIGSIIAVAIIVLSSFSSVVGKVSSDEELVEFDVEFCGLGKKHTIKLTQQQADEVELLFDDIEQRLSEVEAREEAEIIFKDAVVELDKYGLLGGLSIKKAQKLVTGKFCNFKTERRLLSDPFRNIGENSEIYTNTNCFIIGEAQEEFLLTWYFGLPFRLVNSFAWRLYSIGAVYDIDAFMKYAYQWINGLSLIFAVRYLNAIPLEYFFLRPFMIGGNIHYGVQCLLCGETIPSEGRISTFGQNGYQNWTGDLYGNLNPTIWTEDPLDWGVYAAFGFDYWSYPGVSGFFGFMFSYNTGDPMIVYPSRYIGYASKVKLGPAPPFVFDIP